MAPPESVTGPDGEAPAIEPPADGVLDWEGCDEPSAEEPSAEEPSAEEPPPRSRSPRSRSTRSRPELPSDVEPPDELPEDPAEFDSSSRGFPEPCSAESPDAEPVSCEASVGAFSDRVSGVGGHGGDSRALEAGG